MKVCTDACLLGSWFAAHIPPKASILDIGSGTGLQMLMLAQKTDAPIHGIEIDEAAYSQLRENLNASPWKDRLIPFFGDALEFRFPEKYGFIISNPPFFENDLRSPEESSNRAKHDTTLTLQKLIELINHNLTEDGEFGLLLPFHRSSDIHRLAAEFGFHLIEEVRIRQTPRHNIFRIIVRYGRKPRAGEVKHHSFSIRDTHNQYTPAFTELLKDYYLFL